MFSHRRDEVRPGWLDNTVRPIQDRFPVVRKRPFIIIGNRYSPSSPNDVSLRYASISKFQIPSDPPGVIATLQNPHSHLATLDLQPCSLLGFCHLNLSERSISCSLSTFSGSPRFHRLPTDYEACNQPHDNQHPIGIFKGCIPIWRVATGFSFVVVAAIVFFWRGRDRGWLALLCGLLFLAGSLIWLGGQRNDCHECGNCEYSQTFTHGGNVSQKPLDVAGEAVRLSIECGILERKFENCGAILQGIWPTMYSEEPSFLESAL